MHRSSHIVVELLQNTPPNKLAGLYARHSVLAIDGPTLLVRQIEADGNNWFKARLGGENPSYRDVAVFVAQKMGAKFDEKASEAEVEIALIRQFLLHQIELGDESTREQLRGLVDTLGQTNQKQAEAQAAAVSGGKLAAALVSALSHKVVVQIVSKHMAALAARELGKRAIGAVNPLLTVVLLGWTAYDLAGPELRLKRLIESVFDIGMIRISQTP